MIHQEYTLEEVETRLEELQKDIMSLVRLNAKAKNGVTAFEQEYVVVAAEIEIMSERKQKLKDADLEKLIRQNRIAEIEEYLKFQDTLLAKFDGEVFRRLVEKVIVHSMVEVTFILGLGLRSRKYWSKYNAHQGAADGE